VVAGGALRLDAHEGTAWVEQAVRLPGNMRPRTGVAVLEVQSRAPAHAGDAPLATGDLHVDLHGPGYDPDAAELVVTGPNLGAEWSVARAEIPLDGAPDDFALRATLSSGGPVELRGARLAVPFDETVYPFPVAVDRFKAGVTVNGPALTLARHAVFAQGMHLPVRAFDVLLDSEAPGALEGRAYFGMETATRYDQPRGWELAKDAFARRARVHHVAVLPPDARVSTLFVRVDGKTPLHVNELSATDACTLRGYRNPRRLANGLFLYENPAALPRAYTVGQTVRVKDAAAVRDALLDFGPSELGRLAVVTDDVPHGLRQGVVESARFGQRTNDLVVRSDGGPTLLVVNERFDPDFRGTIDGAPARVVKVNGFVRGVVVPAGRHRVFLEYRAPHAVWVGALLCALAVALSLALGLRAARSQNSV